MYIELPAILPMTIEQANINIHAANIPIIVNSVLKNCNSVIVKLFLLH